jgi:hypothetical protein
MRTDGTIRTDRTPELNDGTAGVEDEEGFEDEEELRIFCL